MRDDRQRWPAAQGHNRPALKDRGIKARIEPVQRQTVISGPYEAAMAQAGVTAPAVGSGDTATGDTYAIRLRRDRVMVVGGPRLADGWHETAGIAVADMSQAYTVISLQGTRAETLLQTGTEYTLTRASASAERLWHGFSCLLYRYEDRMTFRIHVPSADLEGLWDMLARQIALTDAVECSVHQ